MKDGLFWSRKECGARERGGLGSSVRGGDWELIAVGVVNG